MSKKEFVLSDRIRIFKEGEEIWTDGTNEIILVEDVKEFIRLLKEEVENQIEAKQKWINAGQSEAIKDIIDRIAGDKLI